MTFSQAIQTLKPLHSMQVGWVQALRAAAFIFGRLLFVLGMDRLYGNSYGLARRIVRNRVRQRIRSPIPPDRPPVSPGDVGESQSQGRGRRVSGPAGPAGLLGPGGPGGHQGGQGGRHQGVG